MKAVLDRFEGELAVFEVRGRERQVPRSHLPPEAREGDVVDLKTYQVDRVATERARARVQALLKRILRKKGRSGDFDL
jgi:hypothetical protein